MSINILVWARVEIAEGRVLFPAGDEEGHTEAAARGRRKAKGDVGGRRKAMCNIATREEGGLRGEWEEEEEEEKS